MSRLCGAPVSCRNMPAFSRCRPAESVLDDSPVEKVLEDITPTVQTYEHIAVDAVGRYRAAALLQPSA